MSNILEIILSGDTRQLDAALSKTQKKLKDFGDSTKAIGKSMSIYVTAPITLAGGAAIKFASDFQESLNKVDVSFKNSSQEVKDFAKTTLESFVIAEGTALDMAALFGDMSTSMGLTTNEAANMSTSLVGLAGDLASFKNINIEEVTTALSSVFTGETESLKRLGIVMTEVNLKQFALEQGITKNIKQFTQAEKVQLRYNYVMKQTANAQGDFANTSEGAANQMRIFQETLKELGAEFGQIMLPTFEKIIKKVNELLKEFRALTPQTKKVILVVAGVVAAIGPLLIAIGTLTSTVIPALITGFGVVTKAAGLFRIAITAATGPIGLIVTAITGLLTIFTSLADKIAPSVSTIDQLKHAFLGLADGTSSARLAMAEFNAQKLKNAKEGAALSPGVEATGPNLPGQGPTADPTTFGLGLLAPNVEKTKKTKLPIPDDLDLLLFQMEGDISGVDNLLSSMGQNLENAFETSQIENFQNTVSNAVDNVKDSYGGLSDGVEEAGKLFGEGNKKILENAKAFNIGLNEIITGGLNDLAVGIGEALGSALAGGGNLVQSLSTVILGTVGNMAVQLGKLAISIGIGVEGIKKALQTLNPAVAIAGGIALIALGSFAKAQAGKIAGGGGQTAFANGGIVSGPVNALVGEYPGAKSNPEVIAPLNKLKNIIGEQGGGGNMNVSGEFVVRGQDLVVALQRADKTRSRIK